MAQKNPSTVEFQAIPGFVNNTVMLTARGTNPTTGYVTTLIQSPHDIHPPQAKLSNEAPGGVVHQTVTPFTTETIELATADGQTHVTVRMPENDAVKVPIGHAWT